MFLKAAVRGRVQTICVANRLYPKEKETSLIFLTRLDQDTHQSEASTLKQKLGDGVLPPFMVIQREASHILEKDILKLQNWQKAF